MILKIKNMDIICRQWFGVVVGINILMKKLLKYSMIQNPEPILQIDLNGNILNEFVSAGEAGDYLGKDSVCGIKMLWMEISIKRHMTRVDL